MAIAKNGYPIRKKREDPLRILLSSLAVPFVVKRQSLMLRSLTEQTRYEVTSLRHS